MCRHSSPLAEISDAWLDHKSGSEKGFSLGYFDDDYMERFDVAVMKKMVRLLPSPTCGVGLTNTKSPST